MFRCFQTYLHLLTRAGIRDFKNNDVYCKRQTTDLSLEFFKIGNKQIKTLYLANFYGWNWCECTNCCGRREEHAILIFRLLVCMRRMYVASIIVNWVEWLWNPSDAFVICFCGPEGAQLSKEFVSFWLYWPIKTLH